jgi:excinuclease ABC subunit A
MLKSSAAPAIRLRGVRHNNLKNFDLDLPLNHLIVITGLSGSGKSSLAFDTLFAEGQRRYIETFSPYARQFFDRMDKPQVDSIEGIPPAISIEQRNSVRTTRSTVGTMTEICDYMKMLWPQLAQLHCRQYGQPVRKDSPQRIWESLQAAAQSKTGATIKPSAEVQAVSGAPQSELLVTFDLPLTEKLALAECLALIARQGYQRLLLNGQIVRLEDIAAGQMPDARGPSGKTGGFSPQSLTVIQDRLHPSAANRARFIEACEQAYHFGKGVLALRFLEPGDASSKLSNRKPERFSNRLHCTQCNLEYREPSPALFSFNHPVGACPTCRGFGRTISIDYDLALPDRSKTLAQGVVKPWQTGMSAECQTDLLRMCRHFEIPTDVPFNKLPKKWQDFVIEGEPGYGKDEEHEWPRAWYGIKGFFRWLESRAYKMHVRVLLSRYRAYTTCPDCQGKRFQPEALLYRCEAPLPKPDPRNPRAVVQDNAKPPFAGNGKSPTLADFYQLPIRDALRFIEGLAAQRQLRPKDALGIVLQEVRSRLGYLDDVGLGYLTLDRPTRTLSGGETERVSLTTCLGTRLVNTLFVLDEPSVGLHPRDTERLVRILEQLRTAGNTVVVVEHEPSVMRAADQIVDLGPGHGATGGQVVFQGTYPEILKSKDSLTGLYLSGKREVEVPPRRTVNAEETSRPSHSFTAKRETSCGLVIQDAPLPLGYRGDTCPKLKIAHVTCHNLNDLSVEIPLGRFVCVTGVSGSGKTTLVREVLLPAMAAGLKSELPNTKASDRLAGDPDNNEEGESTPDGPHSAHIEGAEHLSRVVMVDQSTLGKTPRSNPAVYIGAFDDIREFFAQSEVARQRGLNASAFSFNSAQGQCQRCRGAGFEKIEMQFLRDVFIRCPDCNGRRYRSHILEVRIKPQTGESDQKPAAETKALRPTNTRRASSPAPQATRGPQDLPGQARQSFSIADLLEATVEEAIKFLASFRESRPAQRAVESLRLLQEVGLGYLQLGQPINTLSGGESQRLKLVRHLAETIGRDDANTRKAQPQADQPRLTPVPAQGVSNHARGTDIPGRGTALLAKLAANPSNVAVRKSLRTGTSALRDSRPSPLTDSARTLFLFDEPTTGLHFDDVRVLLKVFQRLVDAGHSVLVIEHNLDVIKSADWILDLGPEAGDQGGQLVVQGTPEEVADCPESHTGRALRAALGSRRTAVAPARQPKLKTAYR